MKTLLVIFNRALWAVLARLINNVFRWADDDCLAELSWLWCFRFLSLLMLIAVEILHLHTNTHSVLVLNHTMMTQSLWLSVTWKSNNWACLQLFPPAAITRPQHSSNREAVIINMKNQVSIFRIGCWNNGPAETLSGHTVVSEWFKNILIITRYSGVPRRRVASHRKHDLFSEWSQWFSHL